MTRLDKRCYVLMRNFWHGIVQWPIQNLRSPRHTSQFMSSAFISPVDFEILAHSSLSRYCITTPRRFAIVSIQFGYVWNHGTSTRFESVKRCRRPQAGLYDASRELDGTFIFHTTKIRQHSTSSSFKKSPTPTPTPIQFAIAFASCVVDHTCVSQFVACWISATTTPIGSLDAEVAVPLRRTHR
jgi:hypothetical protein